MAEFVFKDIVKRHGREKDFLIKSSATSNEEIGSPVHYGTVRKLSQYGISCAGKYAVQLTREDYGKYDLFIGMDKYNIANMRKIFGGDPDGKIHLMLEYIGLSVDVADPWYTGDFNETYDDIKMGCDMLFESLI